MNKIFVNVENLADLLSIKGQYGKKGIIISGGTDIVVRMKNNMIDPEVLISIKKLAELKGIVARKTKVIIGAGTSLDEIENSTLIKENYYPLYQAVFNMASPQLRNMGTIGGNIGNASPAGDTIPPLFLMDAEIILYSKKGKRSISVTEFFKGPGKTVMRDDEIIHSIILKNNYLTEKNSGYIKVGQRNALAISIASVAYFKDKKYKRFAFGSVSPIIHLIELKFGLSDEQLLKEIESYITPIDDVRATKEYRKQVIINLVKDIYF
ncbi:xanthine dehydrogenase family protein subunit M [bacterium]|nr:xanthine dehydrogenase family protein subunit M [bacterium]